MRRSITSLVCGLIGSLICLGLSFFFLVIGSFIFGLSNGSGGALFQVLIWISFSGATVGIVGSALSASKAMPAGAICLTISTLLCGGFNIWFLANASSSDAGFVTAVFFTILPIILLLVATVMAWCAKEQKTKIVTPTNQPNFVPNQSVKQEKTLEQELTELKEMTEKGLLTEDEFSEAKKNLLTKQKN